MIEIYEQTEDELNIEESNSKDKKVLKIEEEHAVEEGYNITFEKEITFGSGDKRKDTVTVIKVNNLLAIDTNTIRDTPSTESIKHMISGIDHLNITPEFTQELADTIRDIEHPIYGSQGSLDDLVDKIKESKGANLSENPDVESLREEARENNYLITRGYIKNLDKDKYTYEERKFRLSSTNHNELNRIRLKAEDYDNTDKQRIEKILEIIDKVYN